MRSFIHISVTYVATCIIYFIHYIEPSISPKDIEVVRISGSMMRVSWTRLTLSEARGFITHYTVAYFPLSSGSKREELNILYQTVGKESSEPPLKVWMDTLPMWCRSQLALQLEMVVTVEQ